MDLKRILDHYREEMHFEVMWDMMLFRSTDPADCVIVKEPSDRYWGADPFLFRRDDTTYLFYEQYDRKVKKGVIAYREVYSDLSVSAPTVVIQEDFHMSFPYIFTLGDNVYMIPETSSAGDIRLYRAASFPREWVLETVIASAFPAVDTILYRREPLELHTSLGDSCTVENYILQLGENLTCVKKIPVKACAERGNRNAGCIITRGDKRYRIGQDCSGKEYGKGLVAYELLPDYAEDEVATLSCETFLGADSAYCGIHTYNEADGIGVIDLKRLRKKPLYQKLGFVIRKGIHVLKRKVGRNR